MSQVPKTALPLAQGKPTRNMTKIAQTGLFAAPG